MVLHRLFCFVLVAMSILVVEMSVYAVGTSWWYDEVQIRENDTNYTVRVWKPLVANPNTTDDLEVLGISYADGIDCGSVAHRTSDTNKSLAERCFFHAHVSYSFSIKGYDAATLNTPTPVEKEVTEANVKAYWDWAFGIMKDQRGNGASIDSGSGDGVSPKYLCWSYSFGYTDIRVGNPAPIYTDNYEETSNPSEGGVIRRAGHVISITSINHCESPYLVIGTSEKWNHSGIYNFSYDYSQGLGDGFKDYLQPK